MGDRPQARHAYYQVKGDLDRYLVVRNSDKNRQRQYSSWEEVRASINDESSTFVMRVSHLDMVPLSIPATGDGYQILHSADGWHRASTATLVHDPATDSYVSAPSRFEGDLVISFKWTLTNWLRAWAYWLWRTALRLVAWVVLLAILVAVGWALWQVPWETTTQTIVDLFGRYRADAYHYSATPTPTKTPAPTPGEMIIAGRPRVGND